MPLILAIEPDKRQASQLTAIVRGRLHAELVLADSADRALAALGDRVPDLVLTSALLSPKDESMLSDRLRALDGHAAHVQTLTIPVLATHSSHGGGRASGVLAALRREKSKSAGQGCDPAVFAEQCKEYLDRGAVERAASLERAATAPTVKEPVRPVSPSPVTGSEWVVVREDEPVEATPTTSLGTVDDEAVIADQDLATKGAETVEATVPPADVVIPDAEAAMETPHVDRALREFLDLPPTGSQGPASLLAAVAALEAEEQNYLTARPPEPAPEPVRAELIAESQPVETIESGFTDTAAEPELRDEPVPADAFTFGQGPSQMEVSAASDAWSADPAVPDAHEDRGSVGGEFESNVPTSPQVGERTPLALFDLGEILRNAPEFAAPQPVKSEPPQPAPQTQSSEDLKEWFDIVEALRRDAEQLDARRATLRVDTAAENLAAEHTFQAAPEDPDPDPAPPARAAAEDRDSTADTIVPQPTPPESPAPVASGTEPSVADRAASNVAPKEAAPVSVPDPPSKRKRRRTKNNPAQDEWGFFDPDQCGFAALIEKLEEITEKDEKPAPRGA